MTAPSGAGAAAAAAPPDDDLILCHQEPIRIPGSIQPHGVLLTLDAATHTVRRASASLGPLLGVEATEALGRPLAALLPGAAAAIVEAASTLEAGDAADGAASDAFAEKACRIAELGLELEVRGVPTRADLAMHRSGEELVLEIDGFAHPDGDGRDAVSIGTLQGLTRRLHRARDVDALCEAIVRETRALSGFDRVMLYRFHPDDHGEVVAESVIDDWPPFLGLHYPESDIPAQARELYRRNWIRCIAAVPYAPSPILPPEAAPLDLSLSHLRSVSPIHVEYLQNMGVGASMSISLLDGERLWGLVACHHRTPRAVPAATRGACELLGAVFSMRLSDLDATERARTNVRIRDLERGLLDRMSDTVPFTDGLLENLPNLAEMVAADGVASISGRSVRRLGATPDESQLIDFAAWFEREIPEHVFATTCIGARYPSASAWPDALAGALVIEISRPRGQYLMAFRREQEQHVRWAGRPDEKHVVATDDGGRRLSPRRSFEAWSEAVRGVSPPWQDVEVRCAETLRQTMLNLIVNMAEELLRLNRELERSRDSLQAFAHIAAHDLKEPLRGIGNYAAFLIDDHGDVLDEEARAKIATISRLVARGTSLTGSLLEFAEIGEAGARPERFDLAESVATVRETFAPVLERDGIELRVVHPLPEIVGDRTRLEQILTNLVSNAVKYNDKSTRWVEIAAEPFDEAAGEWLDGDLDRRSHVVRVSDNGIGIPREQREDTFRLFKRLHRREDFEGNGVGLTIVKRIVELQGGRITLDSEEGVGTTFRFSYGEPADPS